MKEFFKNFVFSFIIFSFIFSLGSFFKIVELLVKGTFTISFLLKISILSFFSTIPYIIPLSFLCGTTALFSTFSIDREIQILSFSGLNPFSLLKSIFFFTFISALFLIYFNFYILPTAKYHQRRLIYSIEFKNPLSFIREKNIIKEIPGITIYIEKIYPNFHFKNISITKGENGKVNFLKAEKGVIKYDNVRKLLIFNLEKGFLITHSPGSISKLDFSEYKFNIKLPEAYGVQKIKPKLKELKFNDLLLEKNLESKIEVNKRILFSLTPFIFLFLGSGVGIKIKHKSRILYFAIGGFTSLLFYQFLIIGEVLARKVEFSGFIWFPFVIFSFLSYIFWKR